MSRTCLKTLKKIESFDEVPSLEEVVELLVKSCNLIINGGHSKIFKFRTLLTMPSRESLNGYLYRNFIHHIYTSEFVDDLAERILTINSLKPVVEIGAGNGKLSHLLRDRGVNIKPIDIVSKTDFVEELDGVSAINKYSPNIILTSWLPTRDKKSTS